MKIITHAFRECIIVHQSESDIGNTFCHRCPGNGRSLLTHQGDGLFGDIPIEFGNIFIQVFDQMCCVDGLPVRTGPAGILQSALFLRVHSDPSI